MSVPNVPAAPVGTAAPAQPVSNDEAIHSFAQDVLADFAADHPTDALDPSRREPKAEKPAESQQEVTAEETPTETPEQPEAETPTPEVPMVEVDIDGEKFTIPEKVKHRVMADKDYRQKTMEVSATRKTLEQHTATAQKLVEQAQQLAPFHAQLYQMDAQAQHLQKLLQSPELATDPLQYNRVQGELAILLHNRSQFAQGVQQRVSQFQSEQQKLRLDKLAVDLPKLLEEFPDLQKPETRQKLANYADTEGLPPEAIDFLNYSATGTKILLKASLYDQMVKDQKAAQAKLKEKVKTLPPATKGRAPDVGAQDKNALERWKKSGGKWTDMPLSSVLGKK